MVLHVDPQSSTSTTLYTNKPLLPKAHLEDILNSWKTLDDKPVNLKGKITVLGFIGQDVLQHKGNVFNLYEKIFDRNKVLIANNEKVYDVYIIPENTKSINNTLNALSKFIDIDFIKRRKVIELSKQVKKFEKIKIFENISWSTLEQIETNKYNLQGVFIAEDYLRIYPYKDTFSHLLGYISKPNQQELALPFISKMPIRFETFRVRVSNLRGDVKVNVVVLTVAEIAFLVFFNK